MPAFEKYLASDQSLDLDSNNNGKIDYTEFIEAFMYSQDYTTKKQIKNAFIYFDKDNSGTISAEKLNNTCRGRIRH